MPTSPFLCHTGILNLETQTFIFFLPQLLCFLGGPFTRSVSDVLPQVYNKYNIFDTVHLYCRWLNHPTMPLFAVYFQLIVSYVQPFILFRDKWLPSWPPPRRSWSFTLIVLSGRRRPPLLFFFFFIIPLQGFPMIHCFRIKNRISLPSTPFKVSVGVEGAGCI